MKSTEALPEDLGLTMEDLQRGDPATRAKYQEWKDRARRGDTQALNRAASEMGKSLYSMMAPFGRALTGEPGRQGRLTTSAGLFKSQTISPKVAKELYLRNGEVNNSILLITTKDGVPHAEFTSIGAALNVALPLGNSVNTAMRPQFLRRMGYTNELWMDVLGITKFYPHEIRRDIFQAEEMLTEEGRRVVDGIGGLHMLSPGQISIADHLDANTRTILESIRKQYPEEYKSQVKRTITRLRGWLDPEAGPIIRDKDK